MTLRRVLNVSGAAAMAAMVMASALAAQGIPRGARISRQPTTVTRLMVANPYVFTSADSATAVSVGRAMRQQMARQARRSEYSVVSDSMMNAALVSYGYSPDAILSQDPARRLAQQLASRVLVTSQMAKGPNGQWSMVSRLAGVNDDAGYTVRVGQRGPLAEMGHLAIDSLTPALHVLADARECMDLRASKPDQAENKARDVLKKMPDNGLAHYCLAQLARDTATKVKELNAAIRGDSLSIRAMNDLAALYEAKGDTAATVGMLQQMLRAAPTDQELRQRAFRYFLAGGRPEAAIEVADEGLKLDPTNWDLWDLKSNACLFSSNFRCAVASLESAYATDSTRADTMFFAKIQIAAEQQLADSTPPDAATAADTATYVKWAQIGAARFADNLTLLKNENKAYLLTGQVDSSVVITRKLLAADTSDATPAVLLAQTLVNAGRYPDAVPFIEFVEQHGDADRKQQAAGVLYARGVTLIQDSTPDFDLAATLLRRSLALAPATNFAPTASYLLGVANLQVVSRMDEATAAAKSCEGAQKMDSLLAEADTALEKGKAFRAEQSATLQGNVRQYRERSQSMIKAYCK